MLNIKEQINGFNLQTDTESLHKAYMHNQQYLTFQYHRLFSQWSSFHRGFKPHSKNQSTIVEHSPVNCSTVTGKYSTLVVTSFLHSDPV